MNKGHTHDNGILKRAHPKEIVLLSGNYRRKGWRAYRNRWTSY